MDLEELFQRISNMERILELGNRPAPESGSEMTREQLIADNNFLREMLRELQRQLEEANQTNKQNGEQIVKLYNLIDSDREEARAEKQKLLAIIESLQSQLAENKKMRFGSKSVKGIDKKPENRGRHDDKDDFDGTSGSLNAQGEEPEITTESNQSKGHSRKGSTYKTFEANAKILHKSDRSQLPEGAESSRYSPKKSLISSA